MATDIVTVPRTTFGSLARRLIVGILAVMVLAGVAGNVREADAAELSEVMQARCLAVWLAIDRFSLDAFVAAQAGDTEMFEFWGEKIRYSQNYFNEHCL